MEFGAAGWLAGLAAAAIPLLLSFLRVPPRRVRVPSLLVWRRLRDRVPPVREMRRPRPNLALLLASLAIAAGVLALAEPSLRAQKPLPRYAICVLDTSPRMQTRHEDQRTSFDHAVRSLRRLLRGLEETDRVVLLARQAGIVMVEGSPARVERTLGEIRAGFCPPDLGGLLAIAKDLRARRKDAEIVVFTDRRIEGVRTSRTGVEKSDNIGIAELSIEGGKLFARIVNAGPPREVTIRWGETEEKLKVPSGDRGFVREWKGAGPVELKLLVGDNLQADNTARGTRVPAPEAVTVSYRGPVKRERLIKALSIQPGVKLVDTPGPVDVVVVCHGAPGAQEAPVLIAIDPTVPKVGPFSLGEGVQTTRLSFEGADPIVKEILYDAGQIRLKGAREVTSEEPMRALIRAGEGADAKVICAMREEGERMVLVMAFDPFEPPGEWSKRASFAVFFGALFERIRERLGRDSIRVLRAGTPVDLAAVPGLEVKGEAELRGGVVVAPRPGRVVMESRRGRFEAVFNLLDARVSENVGEWAPFDGPLFDPGRPRVFAKTPLASLFTVLCLLLVLGAFFFSRPRRAA